MTLDRGLQPVRWARNNDQRPESAKADAKPVRIKAGALGHNLPAHDLIVSPQHRILVGAGGQLNEMFAAQAFAPAKSLTVLPGIRHIKDISRMTWVHFACGRHEVITANGCLSESLLLGPMVVNGLSPGELQTVIDIFGPAVAPDPALNGPPARDCLKVSAVRRRLARHLKEGLQYLAKQSRKWDRDVATEQSCAERLCKAAPLAAPPQRDGISRRIGQVGTRERCQTGRSPEIRPNPFCSADEVGLQAHPLSQSSVASSSTRA